MFDPLYQEMVTNISELRVYLVNHIFIELFFPLVIFIAVMLTLLVDWNWIPMSTNDRARGISLEDLKKKIIE